jgi:hypothetical protein
VRIEATPAVWALLPWGDQTNITAKIENATLRDALEAITRKLGLIYVLKDQNIELQPMPALQRLGRRATQQELKALDQLASTPANLTTDRPTVRQLIEAVDARLMEMKSPFAIESRPGDNVMQDQVVFVARNATLLDALETLANGSTCLALAFSGNVLQAVVRAKADHVTIAVSTVIVFSTAAMFLYPTLYPLISHGLTPEGARAFGVYTGSTIHEVAQVFAAGRSVSETVANTAVITKMVRVMMLAPFLMGLSAWVARSAEHRSGRHQAHAPSIPWFAVAFVGVVLFNTLGLLSPQILSAATTVNTVLLAMAMAALGLSTRISAIRAAGPKPLWLGAMLFVWLIVGGAAINATVSAWLR